MPEKHFGNQILAIARWLTKMAQYFKLMKYLANIWIDVIATCITHAAQA